MMCGRRRHVTDARMAMAVVVRGEEHLALGTGFFDSAEALREARPVFERLELRLGERVVVADIGMAVGLGHL